MNEIRDFFEDAFQANGNDLIRAFKSVLHLYGGRVGYDKECQFAQRLKGCSDHDDVERSPLTGYSKRRQNMLNKRMQLSVKPDRVQFEWWQDYLSKGLIIPDEATCIQFQDLNELMPDLRLNVYDYSDGRFENGLYHYELLLWRENGADWQEFMKRGMELMLLCEPS